MKVHELLSTPEKWHQGAYAQDDDGCPVEPDDYGAIRWCLSGAIEKCYPAECWAIKERVEIIIRRSIPSWNDEDERTHAEVLSLCKELDI